MQDTQTLCQQKQSRFSLVKPKVITARYVNILSAIRKCQYDFWLEVLTIIRKKLSLCNVSEMYNILIDLRQQF